MYTWSSRLRGRYTVYLDRMAKEYMDFEVWHMELVVVHLRIEANRSIMGCRSLDDIHYLDHKDLVYIRRLLELRKKKSCNSLVLKLMRIINLLQRLNGFPVIPLGQ